jgi:hypothetical protein
MAEELIEELKSKWKEKHRLIDIENRKRWIALAIAIIIEFISIVLVALHVLCWFASILIITVAMITAMVINYVVHVRIQKIIWDEQ